MFIAATWLFLTSFPNYLNFIILEQLIFIEQIRAFSSIYINKLVRAYLNQKSDFKKIQSVTQTIFQSLSNPKILKSHKYHLINSLSLIMDATPQNIISNKCFIDINQIKQTIMLKCLEILHSQQFINKLTASAFTIQAFLNTNTQPQIIQHFIKSIYRTLINKTFQIVKSIQQYLKKQIFNDYQTISKIRDLIDLLQLFLQTIKLLISKAKIIKNKVLGNQICFSSQLVSTIYFIIILNYKNQFNQYDIEVKIQQFNALNKCKQISLKLLEIILNYICSIKPIEIRNQFIENKINPVINFILNAVEYSNKTEHKNLMLIILNQCCNQQNFYQSLFIHREKLLFNVILPNIATTDKDEKLFKQHPTQFIKKYGDLIDQQQQKILPNSAASLLQGLSDHLDGFISQTTIFCLTCIQQNINLQFKHQSKFGQLSSEKQVQVCLLCLSILSYKIEKRNDLVKLIQSLVQNYLKYFFHTNCPPIIQCFFANMLSFYQQNIFRQQKISFYYQIIQFLINELYNNSNKTIKLYYIQTLSNILGDQQNLFNDQLYLFIQQLSKKIHPHCQVELIQLVDNLIQTYQKSMKQQTLKTVMDNVVITVISLKSENQSNIISTKCMNILKNIIESKQLIKYDIIITQKIEQLVSTFVQDILNTNYYEDLFLQVNNLISKIKKVPIQFFFLIQSYKTIIHKNHGSLEYLFQNINLLIFYGHNYFEQNPKLYKEIIQLACKYIDYINLQETDQIQYILIIHLILQMHKNIYTQQLKLILISTLRSLHKLQQTNDNNQPKLISKHLSTILLCLVVNFQYSFDLLGQNKVKEILMEQIFLNENYFMYNYNYKLFLYCKYLQQGIFQLIQNFKQYLSEQIANTSMRFASLIFLKYYNKKTEIIQQQVKQIENSFQEIYQGIILFCKCPTIKWDQFDYLRNKFHFFNQQGFINVLSSQEQKFIKKALNLHNIQLQNGQRVVRQIKKIRKIKI